MPKEAKEKATAELNKLKLMSPMSAEATVVRNYIDWLVSVPWKKRTKVSHDLAKARDRSWRPTTTVWRRSRSASSSTWRCSSGSRSSRVRSCAWSVRRAWARPRWASPSPGPPTASSSACPWAACATRPRSAVTAAPISAPCRARSCRTCPRLGRAIRCSCWTRWTRCPWTSAATRPRRCSRCSTPSRTTPSTTTTSRSITTCRT